MTRWRRGREEGYVLPVTALLLVLLMAFAGLTVDVGGWYTRAIQAQRAADAAALAGVVWMPDFDVAAQVARDAAARNGFTDGTGSVHVDVSRVSGDNRRLQVSVRDDSAAQFFSRVFLSRASVSRSAIGEYVLPVPLGSPKNTFGTGNLVFGGASENFWAAVSGYCSGRENGDLHLAHDDRTYVSGTYTCPGLATNPDYDADGYTYAVELAQDLPQSLTIELYDPAFNASGSAADSVLKGTPSVTTTYEVWDDRATPLDESDNVRLSTTTINSGDTSSRNAWMSLYTISSPKAGRYFLKVFTRANEANSYGSNGFGIRARVGSTFSTCTTISGDSGYSASCPQVHGLTDMSIFANQNGSTADFYLAQVDPIHAGKTLQIELFDPGEGASGIQILDPNGNAAGFTWSTACNPPAPTANPSGGCSGTATGSPPRLDVSGTGTKPYTELSSSSKYSDRNMTLLVDLPTNYSSLYGTKTWWKIRYTTTSSSVTDRTTWGASIIGDPVHLVS